MKYARMKITTIKIFICPNCDHDLRGFAANFTNTLMKCHNCNETYVMNNKSDGELKEY